MKLKELSELASTEQIDLADIRKHINALPDSDQALVISAIQAAEATFTRQQYSLANFLSLTRDEQASYFAAVCKMREYYFNAGDWPQVIGFHFLIHQLQRIMFEPV
ncbi:hypothetical protein [Idiomarina sp.]|uniref:hypothetical protein n=1 Tax=Idiomarina sp. TaxID=1874361 RepID=UPI0025BDF25C|nr:hypothetical protein [Idiomarina sp.]